MRRLSRTATKTYYIINILWTLSLYFNISLEAPTALFLSLSSPSSFQASACDNTNADEQRRESNTMRGGAMTSRPLSRLRSSASCARSRQFSRSFWVQSAQRVIVRAAWNGGLRTNQTVYRPFPSAARALATVSDRPIGGLGPLEEYDRRVDAGILRNDEHQRGEWACLSDSMIAKTISGDCS